MAGPLALTFGYSMEMTEATAGTYASRYQATEFFFPEEPRLQSEQYSVGSAGPLDDSCKQLAGLLGVCLTWIRRDNFARVSLL